MKIVRASRGTIEQFQIALENKISEVSAGDRVESSKNSHIESVNSSTYVDYGGIMGTLGEIYTDEDLEAYWRDYHDSDIILMQYDNFEDWKNDTISNMTVQAATIPEDDPARERYLHTLIGDVQEQMDREGLPTNQTIFDTTDDALIITMGGDNVVEFEVPFADLSFDFDRIYEDTDYIVNAMI